MSTNPGPSGAGGGGGGGGSGGGGGGIDHVISSITPITLPSSSVGNFGPAMADAATVSAAADPLSSPTPGMLTTHHLSSTGQSVNSFGSIRFRRLNLSFFLFSFLLLFLRGVLACLNDGVSVRRSYLQDTKRGFCERKVFKWHIQ